MLDVDQLLQLLLVGHLPVIVADEGGPVQELSGVVDTEVVELFPALLVVLLSQQLFQA